MKKRNLSYHKSKMKKLPNIQGSSINLSINNTFIIINQTPEQNSYIKKDILPNIFSYNTKNFNKGKIIVTQIKKI